MSKIQNQKITPRSDVPRPTCVLKIVSPSHTPYGVPTKVLNLVLFDGG